MTQFRRDRRSVAMLFVVPIVVMSLLALIVDLDVDEIKVGLYAEGTSSLFSSDMVDTLSEKLIIEEVYDEAEGLKMVNAGTIDALLVLPATFLEERIEGGTATIAIQMVGKNPALTASVMRELRESLSGVVDGMPALLPASCADDCIEAINTKFPHLDERFSYGNSDLRFIDFHGSFFATFFVFFFGFLFSSLAFLRERTEGTLERLLVSPLGVSEIFLGYLAAFFVFGMVQATVILAFLVYVLKIYVAGSVGLLYFSNIPTVVMANALGILISTVAKREFQVVQFIPVIILPQVLLSNLFWPVERFPLFLKSIAMLMPEYYSDRAARIVMLEGGGLKDMLPSMTVLLGMCAGMVLLSGAVIRRRQM
jgi:ABC-2 type transport system permease protein